MFNWLSEICETVNRKKYPNSENIKNAVMQDLAEVDIWERGNRDSYGDSFYTLKHPTKNYQIYVGYPIKIFTDVLWPVDLLDEMYYKDGKELLKFYYQRHRQICSARKALVTKETLNIILKT